MALADLNADVKPFLGISSSDTSEDARLQVLLAQAIAYVKRYCNRDFESTSYPGAASEGTGDAGYYWGNDTRLLVLRQRPVTALTSVYLDSSGRFGDNPDGAFAASTLLVAGTDYVLRWDGALAGTSTRCSYSGIVERLNGVWPGRRGARPGTISTEQTPGVGNIKVAYTAGYSTIPADLKQAVCTVVSMVRRSADKGAPIASESLGGYSYSIGSMMAGSMPEVGTVRDLLSRWREQPI